MKALTILQPWAWAIAAGHKRAENRTWPTSYRGPIAIHAGVSTRLNGPGRQFLERLGIFAPLQSELAFGAIVATAELVGCVDLDGWSRQQGPWPHDLAGDPFAEGPVCWVLRSVVPIEPIPYRGQQGLFDVPDAIVGGARRVAMVREGAYEL